MVDSEGDSITDRTCTSCPGGEFSTETHNTTCTALTVCNAGSEVTTAGSSSNNTICGSCTVGTTFSTAITANTTGCEAVTNCATDFSPTSPSLTQADQACRAHSCLVLKTAGDDADGAKEISVNGTLVNVYCDMNSQQGGWTQAVLIAGDTNFHVGQVGEVGDFSVAPGGTVTDAKMSDAMINTITSATGSAGIWRFKCASRDMAVTNTNQLWTSAGTNGQSWSVDHALDLPVGAPGTAFDGDFECSADRDGYVFSSGDPNAASVCGAVQVNYGDVDSGGILRNGCYEQTPGFGGWNNPGSLWIR